MPWLVLVLSGVLEAVWAIALAASNGFRLRRYTVLFLLAFVASMAGLAWAMRTIPTGTAYAVWVGIGASLTAVWALVRRQERATLARIGLIALLIASVVGLKVVS